MCECFFFLLVARAISFFYTQTRAENEAPEVAAKLPPNVYNRDRIYCDYGPMGAVLADNAKQR